MRLCLMIVLVLPLSSVAVCQQPDATPLPDIQSLMHQVEQNERSAEAVERNYTYTTSSRLTEFNRGGGVKKTESRVHEINWQEGVRIARLVSRNGKPLSADELKKEDARIAEEVTKAKERRTKADAASRETDSHGHDEIPLSRILELGSFSNARRIEVSGRPTIAVDYSGDPKAKVHNPAENAIREMTGTVCVDERDKSIQHVEGHFEHAFKVGGGMLVSIAPGTWFKVTNIRLNNEVWLPQSFEAHGQARLMLFFGLNGTLTAQMSNYHKYRTSTTILPGMQTVEQAPSESKP